MGVSEGFQLQYLDPTLIGTQISPPGDLKTQKCFAFEIVKHIYIHESMPLLFRLDERAITCPITGLGDCDCGFVRAPVEEHYPSERTSTSPQYYPYPPLWPL